jgi:uncharacterized protein YkwD
MFKSNNIPTIIFAGIIMSFALTLHTSVPRADYFVAEVRSAVLVHLANQSRTHHDTNLATLQINPLLSLAAQMKANDMIQYHYFSHNNPYESYKTTWYWFDRVGYPVDAWRGENLAVDFTTSEGVHRAWMRSPDHRENILLDHYTDIGIATARGLVDGVMTTVVVEMFSGSYE